MNDEYGAILKVHNGKYFFIIPELSLVAEGDTVESAHKDLLARKELLFRQLADADSLDMLRPANNTPWSKTSQKRLTMFLAKTVIIAAVSVWAAVIVLWFAGKVAKSTIHHAQTSLAATIQSARDLPKSMLRNLEDKLMKEAQATASLSEEDKKKMRETQEQQLKALRSLVGKLKPYVNELSQLSPCQQTDVSKR